MTAVDGHPGNAASARAHAVVTGGGTSGHVLPALAIMDRLVAAGHPPSTLHYVGTERGIESRLLPPTGYGFTLLDVVGLQRSLSRRNLAVVPKLIGATRRARRVLPRAPARGGRERGRVRQHAGDLRRTSVEDPRGRGELRPPPRARLQARGAGAAAVAAAFPDSPLPRARLTGAPIRPEVIAVDRGRDRAAARAELGLPADRFVITVFGGSLGAKAINEAVAGLVEALVRPCRRRHPPRGR